MSLMVGASSWKDQFVEAFSVSAGSTRRTCTQPRGRRHKIPQRGSQTIFILFSLSFLFTLIFVFRFVSDLFISFHLGFFVITILRMYKLECMLYSHLHFSRGLHVSFFYFTPLPALIIFTFLSTCFPFSASDSLTCPSRNANKFVA